MKQRAKVLASSRRPCPIVVCVRAEYGVKFLAPALLACASRPEPHPVPWYETRSEPHMTPIRLPGSWLVASNIFSPQ